MCAKCTFVMNSGGWGRGGFFSSLSKLSPLVAEAYERAGEFGDLKLGYDSLASPHASTHLHISLQILIQFLSRFSSPTKLLSSSAHMVDISPVAEPGSLFVALLVAQQRRSGSVAPTGVQLAPLTQALRKVGRWAAQRSLSIHTPRLGWGQFMHYIRSLSCCSFLPSATS
jgi:hypothetical protein